MMNPILGFADGGKEKTALSSPTKPVPYIRYTLVRYRSGSFGLPRRASGTNEKDPGIEALSLILHSVLLLGLDADARGDVARRDAT
jgi:hypothetical protein